VLDKIRALMEVQTAAKGWYSTEQIVAKLLEAEKLQAQDLTMTQLCKRLGISDQTFYRWRLKYDALKEGEAQRLEALEHENAPLKQSVAEQALDISMWRTSNGETGEPGSAPGCGCYLVRRHRVPERKACRVVEERRSTVTRVALSSRVARSIGAAEVVKHLEKFFDQPVGVRAGRRRGVTGP